jgi:glycosyltransferase involved in cell wall biosynthesis
VGELGLADRITFRGRVPRDEIPGRLALADVFLFASIWEEPIARSVMEAMAAGLAVIGTPVGGQREMLEHGVNALVYPPDDAAALAACVQRLRDDRALCARLGDAGRRTVLERYTLDRMADEMERWLEQVAAQPVAPKYPETR